MDRIVTLFVASGLVILVSLAGCEKNRPPTIPQLSGPALGKPGAILSFTFSSIDPENQEVAYSLSWGDTTAPTWSPGCASGQPTTATHSYADSRVYQVRVKARDTRLVESEWSVSLAVSVGFLPPNRPETPGGPSSCTTGVAHTFTARTTHPLGDSICFQFNWNEATGSWGGPIPADSPYQELHSFDSAGALDIRVRARDTHGDTSTWSEPLHVVVTRPGPPAKPVVSYEVANTGADLHLSWTAVSDAESYEIMLDDTACSTESLGLEVTAPSATIEVRSVNANGKSEPATVSCRIVGTPTLVVYGISDPDTNHRPGFGFNTDGTVTTYSLAYANLALIDFYADDVSFPSQMYLINPGDVGWSPKGNAGKAAASSVFDEMRIADDPGTGYLTQLEILADGVYYLWLDRTNNGWSADDNFAKLKIIAIAGRLVAMQVGYQKIPGLRWLAN